MTIAPSVQRRRIAVAVAAVTAFALGLTAIAFGGHVHKPVTVVADAAPAHVAQPTAADPTATTSGDAASVVAINQPTPAAPTADANNNTDPPAQTPAPTSPVDAGPPTRIVAPAIGTWRYHVNGTRKIGAGAPSPIDEDSNTAVSRTGGTDDAPELRVLMQTSTYTRDDTRRYAPDGVTLLATQFSASGAQFGGTLNPPQLLARWPLTVGDTWSGHSTAGSLTIDGTGTVTGERDVTTPAGSFHCWDVQLDATISGSVSGEQHDTSCWVPQLGLPVESHQQLKGTYNGIPFEMNLDFTLLAMP